MDLPLMLMSLVAILYGSVTCFFGYKLFKFQVALNGFLGGLGFGYIIGGLAADSEIVGVIVGFLFGLFCGWLAFKLYLFSVFINSFFLTTVGLTVLNIVNGASFERAVTPTCIVGGLIVGVLAIILVKPVLIITTGMSGGLMTGGMALNLIGLGKLGAIAGLVLGGLGVYFQFREDKIELGELSVEEDGATFGAAGDKLKAFGGKMKDAAANAASSDAAANLKAKAQNVASGVGAAASSAASSASSAASGGSKCPHCQKSMAANATFCSGVGKNEKNKSLIKLSFFH